jgi:hypothetical protein
MSGEDVSKSWYHQKKHLRAAWPVHQQWLWAAKNLRLQGGHVRLDAAVALPMAPWPPGEGR